MTKGCVIPRPGCLWEREAGSRNLWLTLFTIPPSHHPSVAHLSGADRPPLGANYVVMAVMTMLSSVAQGARASIDRKDGFGEVCKRPFYFHIINCHPSQTLIESGFTPFASRTASAVLEPGDHSGLVASPTSRSADDWRRRDGRRASEQ